MVTYQLIDSYPPFEYGATVQWVTDTGSTMIGSICGFNAYDNAEKARLAGRNLGAVTAIVEVSTGKSFEVLLSRLELI